MLKHTITTTDVKALYERLKPRGPKDAYMGLRTEVHEALQTQCPLPYSDHPAHLPKDLHDGKRTKFSSAEVAEILSHQRAQVTDTEILAAERARQTGDGGHRDAHHYVQKKHGQALWEEADRLIKEAGITEGGAS